MINTRTGAHGLWRGNVPGTSGFTILNLSLTQGGRELIMLGSPRCHRVPNPAACRAPGEEVRAVSPAASGGQLSSSRLLLRQSQLTPPSASYINHAVVTPDGRTLTVVLLLTGTQQTTVSVIQVPAGTGTRSRVLYQVTTGSGFSYGFFRADPTGQYLLLNVGPPSRPVNGWIDNGRLIRLRPADGTNVFAETW